MRSTSSQAFRRRNQCRKILKRLSTRLLWLTSTTILWWASKIFIKPRRQMKWSRLSLMMWPPDCGTVTTST